MPLMYLKWKVSNFNGYFFDFKNAFLLTQKHKFMRLLACKLLKNVSFWHYSSTLDTNYVSGNKNSSVLYIWDKRSFSSFPLDYKIFFRILNPKRCGLFGQLRRRGVQNGPLRENGLWMLQFLSKLNKQYLIWKLTYSAKIWDLIEVAEAHTLASGGTGSDRGQNEKKSRRKF